MKNRRRKGFYAPAAHKEKEVSEQNTSKGLGEKSLQNLRRNKNERDHIHLRGKRAEKKITLSNLL